MTPQDFIRKWGDSRLRERQGSQEHFIDLCRLLGEPTPAAADPLGESYCFERGATKVGGGDGWADVWRKGCFGWEFKGKHKDLNAALRQLQAYALDLQNPPYLVVSDMARIIIHTNWTNTVSRRIELTLDDLHDTEKLALLRAVFDGSESLKPRISPQELTAKVAQRFGDLGRRLQERKGADGQSLHEPRAIAHFLNRLVFCMFAEDAELLPKGLFTRLCRAAERRPPTEAPRQFSALFDTMREGGMFGADVIRWFNGGLFDDAPALPLERSDIKLIGDTADEHDWKDIDPAVFGTLFEEALKATRERPALGAHYTDRDKILKIVDPVIVRPLTAHWEGVLATITAAMTDRQAAEGERKAVLEAAAEAMKDDPAKAKAGEGARRKALTAIDRRKDAAYGAGKGALEGFLDRLADFRVLDPACGSGNFLYVALHALKDLERRALVDAERAGLQVPGPRIGLECVRGIEIDAYAAELARVTLWIGDLQWNARNNYTGLAEPILSSLDQIENRDALLDPNGTEAEWPETDVIIGNPPFVGGKRLRTSLGDTYVERLFGAYRGRVPPEADFVCYWVEKAWRAIDGGSIPPPATNAKRAGLVTTNSIRGGANRRVLESIADRGALWEAWADEPWVLEGAAVRVSMIGFGGDFVDRRLEGKPADRINADLSGADVRRRSDKWIVDFGWMMTDAEAALYEAPFRHVLLHVEPGRQANNRESYRRNWWRHVEQRPAMWGALRKATKFIATPRVAKHRIFCWSSLPTVPDSRIYALSREDFTTFGVLSSSLHEAWSLGTASWHGVGNDPTYNTETCFETFPFPEGLTPNIPAADYADNPHAIAIATAAKDLNDKREAWLNPADLVVIEPEVVPGYPDRILPKDEAAAKVLKTRTLTNLYSQRPAWLDMAHRRLDAAVAAAYGWPADLPDEDILARLFALNQERAAAGR